MKTRLMYRDCDFMMEKTLSVHQAELVEDLELDILFDAMAGGDPLVRKAVVNGVLQELSDPDEIRYRQEILKDCLAYPVEIREFYRSVIETVEGEKKVLWLGYGHHPSTILNGAVKVVRYYLDTLFSLRKRAERLSGSLKSEGFSRLFTMLQAELDDEYLSVLRSHVKNLEFHHSLSISAGLGKNGNGAGYRLCRPQRDNRSWLGRMLGRKPESYSYILAPQDTSGARFLSELEDKGINSVARSLAQSAEHIRNFYINLRDELSFYIGCLNLYDRLTGLSVPVCFPRVFPLGEYRCSWKELCDVSLSLTKEGKAVGNDGVADGKRIVIITGANQGGKSTFLRSVGQAFLMTQCGMFAPAESLEISVGRGIFTHFKRQEDREMISGKFDEELSRMSRIVDSLSSGSVILFNESFASTNEREGSEIARQIVSTLAEKGVRLFFVTHLLQLARELLESSSETSLFLRAPRCEDGTRTFKLIEAAPLDTSFGKDLYKEIFSEEEHRERIRKKPFTCGTVYITF